MAKKCNFTGTISTKASTTFCILIALDKPVFGKTRAVVNTSTKGVNSLFNANNKKLEKGLKIKGRGIDGIEGLFATYVEPAT